MSFCVVFCNTGFENLGIEYLSAGLRQHNVSTALVFDPQLFDDPFVSIRPLAQAFDLSDALPRQVLDHQPDLVAFSVVAANYRWALRCARRIKRLAPVPIVFGGIHATAVPWAVMKNPEVDFCVVGEGDQALTELALALRDGTDVSLIENLWYRQEGSVMANPVRPLIEDLDSLPFPDKALFYRVLPEFSRAYTVITRRGCIYRCSYCHNTTAHQHFPAQGGRIRLRSVDNVIEELSTALSRYAFERVRIDDDLFSYNADWLVAFCRRYRAEIRRPFLCFCSPNDLTRSVVRELKRAGCFQVCVGVQDVQESVRRSIFSRNTPQRAVTSAIANLRRERLRATVDNIIGYPGQTEADLKKVAEFYLDNPVYGRFTVFRLIYFAGTAITRRALRDGVLSKEQVEALENRPTAQANTRGPEQNGPDPSRQLHLFLIVSQMLPLRLARWIYQRGLYDKLPPLNPSVVEGVWTLFTDDRLDPVRQRYFVKYRHFAWQAIRGWLVKEWTARGPRRSRWSRVLRRGKGVPSGSS